MSGWGYAFVHATLQRLSWTSQLDPHGHSLAACSSQTTSTSTESILIIDSEPIVRNVRILLVSGLPDDEAVRTWANNDGFDAFPKPFTAQALKERLREVLTGEEQFCA